MRFLFRLVSLIFLIPGWLFESLANWLRDSAPVFTSHTRIRRDIKNLKAESCVYCPRWPSVEWRKWATSHPSGAGCYSWTCCGLCKRESFIQPVPDAQESA